MDSGHELVTQTETAYAELREALEGVPEARMTEAWLGTWSVREILIHMSGWHRQMIPALARIARGEAPYPDGAYDDFDTWNARFVDVLAELAASHRDFVAAAAALADEHLARAAAPAPSSRARAPSTTGSTRRRSASGERHTRRDARGRAQRGGPTRFS
jgi:hypothetical protein